MTTISYTYEIIRVDPENKAMDIVYTSPQFGSITVGARMPWEGETIEGIVRAFEPVRYWLEQTFSVAPVDVGTGGVVEIQTVPEAPPIRTASKIALVRAMRDIAYGDTSLWDAVKAQLASADEATQEDWQLAVAVDEADAVFTAIFTTLYGEDATAQITALFTAAGAQ